MHKNFKLKDMTEDEIAEYKKEQEERKKRNRLINMKKKQVLKDKREKRKERIKNGLEQPRGYFIDLDSSSANNESGDVFIDEKFKKETLSYYAKCIKTGNNKIIKLKFFGHDFNKNELKPYDLEIARLHFLADKENWKYLIDINRSHLRQIFGEDYNNYGISNKQNIKDLFPTVGLRSFENYIFIHSDAYLQAIKNAPKIPIQDWSIVYKNPGVICENRKVLFNIDGEILLGEFIREKTINGNYLKPDANSSIGFFVYYKGLPSGKFNVERWDYEPGCFHKNKFDSDGKFKVNGARAKNVAFSHRHVYTLGQRLIFGKNFSADVYPTPINYGNTGEERHYEKFQDIVEDFLNEFSLQKGSFLTPSEKINGKLKKIGLKYCPCYSVKEQKIIENPVFDENLKQNKFHLSSEKHLNRDFSLSSQNVLNANASNYSNLLSSGSVEEENELCR